MQDPIITLPYYSLFFSNLLLFLKSLSLWVCIDSMVSDALSHLQEFHAILLQNSGKWYFGRLLEKIKKKADLNSVSFDFSEIRREFQKWTHIEFSKL